MLVGVVTPPPQLNVVPAVVEDAVNTWLVVVQVRMTGGAIPALGGLTVWETVTEAVDIHPFEGSVTVIE